MSALLAASFFDEPGLIGVRLGRDDDPVVRFATAPRPLGAAPTKRGGCATPALIMLGVIGTLVGGSLLVTTCHERTAPSRVPPALPAAAPWTPPPVRVSAACDTDCDGGQLWKAALTSLDARLAPRQPAWQPWFVRTLLRVPQTDPAPWQTPRASVGDAATREAALALAEAFATVDSPPDTALVLDLPGPQSVAAAGALCDRFEPVFTFDNIPDGAGVVPAQDTLGAVLYWLPRLQRGAAAREGKTCAPMFVLDAARLNPYRNEADRFDNRYRAKLPTAEALKAAGIARVLYVRPETGAVQDSDDLNETLVAWREAGVEVKALGLSALAPVAAPAADPTPGAPSTPPAGTESTHVYHHCYGNGWAPYFWHSYGWFGRPGFSPSPTPAPLPNDSAWAPQTRSGLFSGLSAPPASGARRPAYVPPAASSASRSSPSRSSPGGSWGRSWGGSTFS